jgi:hypothetical protein
MDGFPDVFGGSAMFSTTSLTQAINVIPNMYGRTQELGIFGAPKGIPTTSVVLEQRNGVLHLLSTKERGTPANGNVAAKRSALSFMVPHIPLDEVIKAEDFQGVRMFGSQNQLETLQNVMLDRQESMAQKHYITWEYHRMGALSGKILDADGSTLHDLFTAFGVSQKVVDFVLGTEGTSVQEKCLEVTGHIEDNLQGEVMDGVHALCSPTWFNKFIKHPSVREAFKYYSSVQEPLRTDPRKSFPFAGITFEEYRGKASFLNADGTTSQRLFVPDGDVRFFPTGTQNTFTHTCAPADFVETANTIGLPLYMKAEPGDMNRWIDLHAQSNPLFLCNRPALLVRGHSSD